MSLPWVEGEIHCLHSSVAATLLFPPIQQRKSGLQGTGSVGDGVKGSKNCSQETKQELRTGGNGGEYPLAMRSGGEETPRLRNRVLFLLLGVLEA